MNPQNNQTTIWRLESQLAPYVDALTHYFTKDGYASNTGANYIACIAHFLY